METPVLGIQLNGYTLIRLIARGGMGEVYEATETKLQRRVALKLIAPPNPLEHDQDELVRRFLKEARTLAQINHPNVATIFSIDSIGGVPFLAMEYIDGVSFRELLEEFTFASDGALPLFQQMLEGLKALHDVRILHRDLKPHNILLRPDGQVKILDFGIAKEQAGGTDLTRAGIVVGTLPYMPPELKVGVPASVRSDIWSLGAIFYECLTGTRLVVALKENVGHHDVPFNLEQQRRIPKDVRAFLGKMCASRPQDRFASVDEALVELQRMQSARPPASSRIMSNLSRKIAELARVSRAEPESLNASARLLELVELSRGRDPVKPTASPGPVIRESQLRNSEAITLKPTIAGIPPQSSVSTARPRAVPLPSAPEKKAFPLGYGILAAVVLLLAAFAKPILSSLKPPVPVAVAPVAKDPVPEVAVAPAPAVELALTLREPADGQQLWLEPTSIATFSWTRFLTPNQYEIQIARDANFQKMIVRESVTGNKFRPGQILSDGSYYWRLWPHEASAIVSPTFHFSVGLLSAVELNEPDAEHVFVSGKGSDITLSWSTKPSINKYRLQISNTLEFNSPSYDAVISANQTTLPTPAPGEHYWRVRPEDMPQATKYWSMGRQFLVKAAPTSAPLKRAGLREPRLSTSKQSVTLNFRQPPRDVAAIAKSLSKAPELKWEAVPGARQYLVQLSSSKDFTRPIYEEHVKAPRVSWRTPVPGKTYWRVAALGNGVERSGFSPRGELEVRVPAPALKKTYAYQLDEGAPNLQWAPSPLAERYLVQIGRERNLASSQETTVTTPKLNLDMGKGQYFARVAAADVTGQPISAYSPPAKIEINDKPALAPGPKLLQPSDNAHATSVSGRISIVFSWSEVVGASIYALEVASDPEFKNILERRSETARGSLFRQADFKGRVYWRVRAKSAQGYTEWSKPFHFDLK